MPQDTTIYWDGKGEIPALIDSLPLPDKQLILQAIHNQREQVVYKNPSNYYLYFVCVIIILIIVLKRTYSIGKLKEEESGVETEVEAELISATYPTPSLNYAGSKLNFSIAELTKVLLKHAAYFVALNPFEREKFIDRLQTFIKQKTFVIHDTSGFKEMPILISAAAIQLTFGLEKFLLPNFSHIHIFPEEFIGVYPTLRILEGNVSGNTINLSWKHFLAGFAFPDDGQNVGLHEMAHAYYYQFFETGHQADENFVSAFPAFANYGNKVFEQEARVGYDLYSDYALLNFQEFWAASIEIFFENPAAMKTHYPELYAALCTLLNQYPLDK